MTKEKDAYQAFIQSGIQRLQDLGLRNTQSRRLVLQHMISTETPQAPLAVFESLERVPGAKIDKVTVYRVLETFTEAGITQKLADGRFVVCRHGHDSLCSEDSHMIAHCTRCKQQVMCHLDKALGKSISNALQPAGFLFHGGAVEVWGECSTCTMGNSSSPKGT